MTTVCPISFEKTDHNATRVTGLLTIATLALFAATGWVVVAAALTADYTFRAWTGRKSPMQRLGARIARAAGIPVLLKDAAPKRFAARVGFGFAAASLLLVPVSPTAATVVALSLLGFNVLDAVFDFCVGCWMYGAILFPLSARVPALARIL